MPLELCPQMYLSNTPNSFYADCCHYSPTQAHDTTSIYIAAQKQNRIRKDANRRASTNVPPAKSCLSAKPVSEPSSPTKVKRKVSFADDKGLSLTEVRVMKNEINDLPKWTQEMILQVFPLKDESNIIQSWDPLFPQPASDYMAFRTKIDKQNVALENVIVKKEDNLLTGTIKVKNVCFEKHVFVRASFDCWASHQDYPAIFVPQGNSAITALFDTFSFSIKVPDSATRYGIIELCVGYKTSSAEYWDSNSGKNYKLALISRRTNDNTSPLSSTSCLASKVTSYSSPNISSTTWPDFSTWNEVLAQGPYW